jgi:hypothetical protein
MTATPTAPLTAAGAIDFPDTTGQPTDGSFQVIAAGRTYSWNGSAWRNIGAADNVSAMHDLSDLTDAATQLAGSAIRGIVVRHATRPDYDPDSFAVIDTIDYGTY